GLQPEGRQVIYRDGGRESYDALLIASGAQPVKPDIAGLDEVGSLPFHTLEDCRALQRRLADGAEVEVAIYGGGLVAVELAIALLEAGQRVKLIVRSRILRRYFDADAGSLIEDSLSERGAKIYKGSGIEEVRGENLVLSDGRSLGAGLLVVALGVRPETSFLEGTGIELADGGVLVDRRMRTNLQDIYAAGDVAAAPGLFSGSPGLSAILPSAIEQGKVAGSNMAGEVIEYEGWVPMNILNLFGHRALSIGIQEDDEAQVLKEIDRQRRYFKRLVFRDGRLIGAAFLNSDVFPGVIQYLVRKRVEVGKYAELLLQKPRETSAWLMLKTEREETLSLEA
ncbi:MAG: NAD(P)/FAD-dependent oxidoreductase, partial [Candidatus Bipolaricaulia bacterium]